MRVANCVLVLGFVLSLTACPGPNGAAKAPVADTGVKQAHADISTGNDGMTTEQRNVKKRLEMDNSSGSIKHLYVVSSMSGDVIVYSTVKGKVTSSGKRLTPRTVDAGTETTGQYNRLNKFGVPVNIGGANYRTTEVIQDDGTFGSSIPYLYWWDAQGRYHQHYVTGGQILHISDQPIRAAKVILNMEVQGDSEGSSSD